MLVPGLEPAFLRRCRTQPMQSSDSLSLAESIELITKKRHDSGDEGTRDGPVCLLSLIESKYFSTVV